MGDFIRLVYTYDPSTSSSSRSFFLPLCLRRPSSHVVYACDYACACVVRVNRPILLAVACASVHFLESRVLTSCRLSVRVVSSSRSGVGKSLFVRRLSEELENSKKILNNDIAKQRLRNMGADVPPLIAVVPIHERTVNQSAVVGALLQHSIAPNIPLSRICHIDVSPSVSHAHVL